MIRKYLTAENKVFYKTLIMLSIPMILQNLLNSLVNLTDSFMVGSLGVNAINGVGFGNELFFLYTLILFGIGSGSSIFMGQYWGKGEVDNIHKVMGICFIISLIASVVFAAIAFAIPEIFISFYTKEDKVIELGSRYLRIIAITYLLTALTLTINNALRCINQTKIPMMTTFVALIINVFFNYIFIYIFKWGVAGSATATAIARFVELLASLFIICRLKLPIVTKIRNYFKINTSFIKPFLLTIAPVVLNEFLWAVGTTLYNVAYKTTGNDAQAAVRISSSIQNLFNVIGMGIGTACSIMLANQLGANSIAEAKRNAGRFMRISIVISAVMGILLAISAPLLTSFYDISDKVRSDAIIIMYIISAGMIIKTYNFTTICGILRSGGDTRYCLMIDMVSVWFVGVPLAFIGAYIFKLPIHLLVLLVLSEEVVKTIATTFRVQSNIWAKQMV